MPAIALNLQVMLPEFIVLGTALAAIITELLLPADRRSVATAALSFVGLVIAFVVLLVGNLQGAALRFVDEAALIDVLQNNKIAGAGLDVFDVEPLPLDHPLRDMPNMVIMPHLGYVIEENFRNWYGGTVENLRSWLDGKTINQMSGRNPTTPG